jgi:lysophospholipase L1-like esterase
VPSGRRHSAHAETLEGGDSFKILCFGDSITAGFHSGGRCFEPYGRTMGGAMRSSGCDVSVLVNGLSGLTAREMVAKAKHPAVPDCTGKVGKGLEVLLNQKPDLVIIMAGTNDLGMGVNPQAILADVVRLHKACHAQGIRTVALAPSTVAQGPSTLGRQQLASLLRKWAKTTPAVVACMDMMDLVPHNGPSPHWDMDDLHLSARGSRALGRRLSDQLKHLVHERAPDSSCAR